MIAPTARTLALLVLAAPLALVTAATAPAAWPLLPLGGLVLLALVGLDGWLAGPLREWRLEAPDDAEVGRPLTIAVIAEIARRVRGRATRDARVYEPRIRQRPDDLGPTQEVASVLRARCEIVTVFAAGDRVFDDRGPARLEHFEDHPRRRRADVLDAPERAVGFAQVLDRLLEAEHRRGRTLVSPCLLCRCLHGREVAQGRGHAAVRVWVAPGRLVIARHDILDAGATPPRRPTRVVAQLTECCVAVRCATAPARSSGRDRRPAAAARADGVDRIRRSGPIESHRPGWESPGRRPRASAGPAAT